MSRNLITKKGYEDLARELKYIATTLRLEIAEELSIAREHGDLSENAEYDYAKNKQGLNEAKIAKISGFLAEAEIISHDKSQVFDKVVFGTSVLLFNTESELQHRFKIVGETETDIKNGKISFKSPLGSAVMGRCVGDDFDVETPKGGQCWEVLEIGF